MYVVLVGSQIWPPREGVYAPYFTRQTLHPLEGSRLAVKLER